MTNCPPVNDPKKLTNALNDPMWLEAMHEKLLALDRNNTWVLVLRTLDMNVVGSKWMHKTKFKSDGSVERYKARLVAQGLLKFQAFTSMKVLHQSLNLP